MKAHRNNSKTFEELDYVGQAKSITAQAMSLKRAIKAHERRAIEENMKDCSTIKDKCIMQVTKMLEGL
ncbi:MAG: hypothetical protein LBM08_05940 [Dysgonamonadaceae bacterium]|jgi:hypothetical protein|nr:hypothetical protein [Dysgonamonadaceae bacterium]